MLRVPLIVRIEFLVFVVWLAAAYVTYIPYHDAVSAAREEIQAQEQSISELKELSTTQQKTDLPLIPDVGDPDFMAKSEAASAATRERADVLIALIEARMAMPLLEGGFAASKKTADRVLLNLLLTLAMLLTVVPLVAWIAKGLRPSEDVA